MPNTCGGAVVFGALLLVITAIGVPAAAVWAGANLAADAPAPTFYVAGID